MTSDGSMQTANMWNHQTCPEGPEEDEETTREAAAPPVALMDHCPSSELLPAVPPTRPPELLRDPATPDLLSRLDLSICMYVGGTLPSKGHVLAA